MDAFHLHWLSQSDVPTSALVTFLVSISFVLLVFRYVVLTDNAEKPVSFGVPLPEQCSPDWKGEVLEEPAIKVSGSAAIQCYCPANGRSLGRVNPATADGIDRAIARAGEAQKEWAKTTFELRRRVLKTLLRYILENQDSIAHIACLDSGKTMIDASLGEILVTVEKLQWTIKHGEKALSPEKRPTNFLMMYKSNEVRYEPLGVVAACVSWNYPFHNFISPFVSTLFTGSALILKASEQTAWSTQRFALIAKRALTACGHSPELIQPILCWPETASHLTSHPGISHITFIGSRPIAHKVAASASKALIPLCVELGGKDPAIVLDDVRNLDKVASVLMRGTFISAGQNCVGIERIICLPSSYDRLVQILQPRVRSLRVGDTLAHSSSSGKGQEAVDVGALISCASFSRIEQLIASAVQEGARLVVGGQRYSHPQHPKGHYFAPTLLLDVTPSMSIAQEEVFAPVMLLMRAPSVNAAIEMANSTPYALGSSVFGTSKRDLETVTKGVKAGMVSVNDFGVYHVVSLPFGGAKGSGYGRFGGQEGLRNICNIKAVTRDRWPGLVGTSIPPVVDYPIRDVHKGWIFVKGVIGIGYASGWAWAESLLDVINNS